MSNEQLARDGLQAIKKIERMLVNDEEYDDIYEEFVNAWVGYYENGGDIEQLLRMLSKEQLVKLFYIYLQQHG